MADFINAPRRLMHPALMHPALADLGRRWDSLGQRAAYHPGPNPTAEAMAGREMREESTRRWQELPAWKKLLTRGPMSRMGGPTVTQPLVSEEERAQMLEQARQQITARDLARKPPAQLFQTAQEADRAEIEALLNNARGGRYSSVPVMSFENTLTNRRPLQPPSQRRDVEQGRVQGREGMPLYEQLLMDEIARDAEYQWWDKTKKRKK
jgi:hypothetical protein